MKIAVHFFSRLRDIVGASRLDLELADGQTLAELLAGLYAAHPELRRWDAHLLTAIGLDYAERGQVLNDGDDVSIMPPVQGG